MGGCVDLALGLRVGSPPGGGPGRICCRWAVRPGHPRPSLPPGAGPGRPRARDLWESGLPLGSRAGSPPGPTCRWASQGGEGGPERGGWTGGDVGGPQRSHAYTPRRPPAPPRRRPPSPGRRRRRRGGPLRTRAPSAAGRCLGGVAGGVWRGSPGGGEVGRRAPIYRSAPPLTVICWSPSPSDLFLRPLLPLGRAGDDGEGGGEVGEVGGATGNDGGGRGGEGWKGAIGAAAGWWQCGMTWVGGGEEVAKGPHTTSQVPYDRRARWRFVCAAIQRVAGGEVRLCARPLRAAAAYDRFRRIYKKGQVRGVKR